MVMKVLVVRSQIAASCKHNSCGVFSLSRGATLPSVRWKKEMQRVQYGCHTRPKQSR